MDCVGCDKCKLWGKVQVVGVGTEILFTRRHLDQLQLSRSEIELSLMFSAGENKCTSG